MISIPPFTIIAFELMVLFGALSAFLGFILMARMPDVITVVTDREFKDDFEIRVKNGGVS
jgi:multisubunit Na+/H+ antiporter MnhG subunit